MFTCFTKESSVINSIYSGQLFSYSSVNILTVAAPLIAVKHTILIWPQWIIETAGPVDPEGGPVDEGSARRQEKANSR
jgi:hypothetical protein